MCLLCKVFVDNNNVVLSFDRSKNVLAHELNGHVRVFPDNTLGKNEETYWPAPPNHHD